MQAYYPDSNRQGLAAVTTNRLFSLESVVKPKIEIVVPEKVKPRSNSAPLVNSKQLDPWTLYELQKETQKIQSDVAAKHDTKMAKKIGKKKKVEPVVAAAEDNSSSMAAAGKKNKGGSKKSKKKTSKNRTEKTSTAVSNSSRRRSSLLLPMAGGGLLRHGDKQEVIESAKSKRQSLLVELKVRNLYEGRRRQTRTTMEDSSLPSVLAANNDDDGDDSENIFDDGLFMEDDIDKDDMHHQSCYF